MPVLELINLSLHPNLQKSSIPMAKEHLRVIKIKSRDQGYKIVGSVSAILPPPNMFGSYFNKKQRP